jgi:hypothetical protein
MNNLNGTFAARVLIPEKGARSTYCPSIRRRSTNSGSKSGQWRFFRNASRLDLLDGSVTPGLQRDRRHGFGRCIPQPTNYWTRIASSGNAARWT